jgi:hypothetical protein
MKLSKGKREVMDHLRLGEEVGDEVHTDRFESGF